MFSLLFLLRGIKGTRDRDSTHSKLTFLNSFTLYFRVITTNTVEVLDEEESNNSEGENKSTQEYTSRLQLSFRRAFSLQAEYGDKHY